MHTAHYKTLDRYLASYLLAEGAVLAGCTRLGPKTVEYRYLADRSLHEMLRRYWSGLPLLIPPIRLFKAHQHLKSLSIARP